MGGGGAEACWSNWTWLKRSCSSGFGPHRWGKLYSGVRGYLYNPGRRETSESHCMSRPPRCYFDAGIVTRSRWAAELLWVSAKGGKIRSVRAHRWCACRHQLAQGWMRSAPRINHANQSHKGKGGQVLPLIGGNDTFRHIHRPKDHSIIKLTCPLNAANSGETRCFPHLKLKCQSGPNLVYSSIYSRSLMDVCGGF